MSRFASRNITLLVCSTMTALGCAAPAPQASHDEVSAEASEAGLEPVIADTQRDAASVLRAIHLQQRNAEADASYRVTMQRSALLTDNAEHLLSARYEAERFTLEARRTAATERADWSAELRFAGVGRDGARSQARLVRMHGDGTRVTYDREGVSESYVNGPLGIEQTFELERAPAGRGMVGVAMAIDGVLEPVLAANGARVELRDEENNPVLAISELLVRDATGRVLASSMAVDNSELELRYDDTDAVYPVQIDPFIATLRTGVKATKPQNGASFGKSVAIVGNTAVVGAPYDGKTSAVPGGYGDAYVYTRSGTSWVLQAHLKPSGLADNTEFGAAVAMTPDGATIAVGAPNDGGNGVGAVYVFTRSGSTWTQQKRITTGKTYSYYAGFGWGLALETVGTLTTLVVGMPYENNGTIEATGGVWIFGRSGTTWTTKAEAHILGTSFASEIGQAVAISGSTVVWGEGRASSAGLANAGFVSVYTGAGSPRTWTRQASLLSPALHEDGGFGRFTAIAGNTLVANEFEAAGSGKGMAQVFTRSGTTWTHRATLVPSGVVSNARYAIVGLSRSGGTLVLASEGGMTGTSASPPTIWKGSAASWVQQTSVPAPVAGNTYFGWPSSVTDTDYLAGAPQSSSAQGAAYFYSLANSVLANGAACTANADCGSGICVDGVCCNSTCGGGVNDCQACSTAKGGTSNGTCTALSATAAPQTVCRAVAGACDVPETCNTSSVTCPNDLFTAANTTCRTTNRFCDPVEVCSGTAAACPADLNLCGS